MTHNLYGINITAYKMNALKTLTKVCENKTGGYECSCRNGFRDLVGSCEDIDECALAERFDGVVCAEGEECVNYHGYYKCEPMQ